MLGSERISDPDMDVPVVDYPGDNPSDADLLILSREIISALGTHGFFYLRNSSVTGNTADTLFKKSETFFTADREEKIRCARTEFFSTGYWASTHLQGLKEGFHYVGLQPADRKIKNVKEEKGRCNTEIVQSCDKFWRSGVVTACVIMRCIAIGLGLDKDYFTEHYFPELVEKKKKSNLSMVRVNYYPAVKKMDTSKDAVRDDIHKDASLLTLLVTQPNSTGLQTELPDGTWAEVDPLPGAVLIQPGEMLEKLTSQIHHPITANRHYVAVPEREEHRSRHRQSLVFFLYADNNKILTPINRPETEQRFTKTKTTYSPRSKTAVEETSGEFLKDRFQKC